jgi:hypothetical protein
MSEDSIMSTESTEKEIWRPIEGYEGLYEVSNMGRIKIFAKSWIFGNHNTIRRKRETISIGNTHNKGYLQITLYNNRKQKTFKIHKLVWDHFGNKPSEELKLQIDHINSIKTDNRIDNLQLLTNRQNISKYYKTQKTSSKYIGVCWNKNLKKWIAYIKLNQKLKHLGYFTDEVKASQAYQEALTKIKEIV